MAQVQVWRVGTDRFPTALYIRSTGPHFPAAERAAGSASPLGADATPVDELSFAFLWTHDAARAFALVMRGAIASGGVTVADDAGLMARLVAVGHSPEESRGFVSRVLQTLADLRTSGQSEPGGDVDAVLVASARLFLGLPMAQVVDCRDRYQATMRGQGEEGASVSARSYGRGPR